MATLNIVFGGLFHAAVLFLVAAGLQIVFGVQKIVNLACGSFYALGAYFGISAVGWAVKADLPQGGLFLVLLLSGIVLAIVLGPAVERLLRLIYDRDEHFQILLTFALVLIFEDAIRFFWGTSPLQMNQIYVQFGGISLARDLQLPTYNVIVIATAVLIMLGMGWFLKKTNIGRLVRATAENRRMSEALCVNVSKIYAWVFTLGVMLGTVGGALVVPATAASLDMGIDLIIEAFAVVIIGGLGSMGGAFAGALIVALVRSVSLATFPEFEMLAIYAIVIVVLVLRPAGLFGRTA